MGVPTCESLSLHKPRLLIYNPGMRRIFLIGIFLLLPASAAGDALSAAAAMENPANPLVLINTETGPVYVELLPGEAPANVANFLSLIEPAPAAQQSAIPGARGYYDGMRFHRVIPGFLIQSGSPALHDGGREVARHTDEINADALGLDTQPVMYANGEFNPLLDIQSKQDLEAILLRPLYRRLGITSNTAVASRQEEILAVIAEMSVKDAYAQLGYRFESERPGRGLRRGALALANRGPDDNGAEFFISLSDAPHLDGRYTIIGQVVEGMAAADRIGAVALDAIDSAVDPMDLAVGPNANGRLIYSIRRIN